LEVAQAIDLFVEMEHIVKNISVKARDNMTDTDDQKQRLHLVFGGELTSLAEMEFRDLGSMDIVGIFPDYASALAAWKAKAQATVDNAHMRYFIVHLHRLLQPETRQN
jgi:Domain of unknown function (DUF4170)